MLGFTTKAQTLAALESVVKHCRVLPQVCFTVRDFSEKPQNIAQLVETAFGGRAVIVRSSALTEDGEGASQAGKYLSVAGVQGCAAFLSATEQVVEAFGESSEANQIFVQPMLRDVAICGVLFTVDPNTGGNYFVMNYDCSGSTDSVTSGTGTGLQTCYCFRSYRPDEQAMRPPFLQPVLGMAEELMRLFENDKLDLEFAIDRDGVLYLLQVRPLAMRMPQADLKQQAALLARMERFLQTAMQPQPYVLGKRSIYGVMPDWNPAEMIGIRPRPLSLSLYRRLITDKTWAFQRDNYGYRNLRSCPLLWDFCGLPYIDTRISFNSFIPKEIPDELAERLADYYLEALAREPDKHDKVEFEIIFTCFTFDLDERIKILLQHGFSEEDCATLREALLQLTSHVIHAKSGLWKVETQKIANLEKRFAVIQESTLPPLQKLYWLLEDCSRYGTLPFAGLARAGFIAVQILRSLVRIGILDANEYSCYMSSLQTVSSDISCDRRNLSKAAFLKEYGHLRPGTYDILAKRYDDAPELYFFDDAPQEAAREHTPFKLSLAQFEAIQAKMAEAGMEGDVLSLFAFVKAGIEGREAAKFVFTRSVSESLELLAQIGAEHGISREDMSYFDIREIDALYSSSLDVGEVLRDAVTRGKARYTQTLGLTLPEVIVSPQDVYLFHLLDSQPNYITQKVVSAPLCASLEAHDVMRGAILLLEAADPGYDWIFSVGIAGFVTAYGGANSHMAIRAGELGIPAAVGVGAKQFQLLQAAHALQLDCANRRMEVLR